MEEILDFYAEPYDPKRPKVNFDETRKQLIKETRTPLPGTPGQVARYDYEYERNGIRNLFLFCEPQAGWRHIVVTEQRTMHDFAHQMQWLVDEGYPEADVVRVEASGRTGTHLGPGRRESGAALNPRDSQVCE